MYYKILRNNIFSENKYYHIFNRGNRKELIFIEENDYIRFLSTLNRYSYITTIVINSYCLMPNHYHLILNSGSCERSINIFMHRVMTSYAIYFNRKYDLIGRLCQSKYRASIIENLKALDRVMEYLNQNPVKAGFVSKPEHYKWLSHNFYTRG